MNTLHLYATGTDELLASVPVPGAALVNPDRRLIGGLAVPWNVPGMPSTGRTIFRPGSVTVPADAAWCKLLIEHDTNRAVGHLSQAQDTPAGLLAALAVAPGPAGDAAMADASEAGGRVRDAMSVRVEVDDWRVMDDGTLEIVASRLREISLVAVPAYDRARASVLASLPPTERDSAMAQLRQMLDLTASAPAGTADPTQTGQVQGPPDTGSTAQPPATGSPQTAPPAVTAAADPQAVAAALAPLLAAAMNGGQRPGEVPAGPPNGGTGRRGIPTVTAAAQAVVAWQNEGQGNPAVLMAALNDVIPANDAGGATAVGDGARPQWLDELWTARQSSRPWVDALGAPKRLTGMKAKGWRWVERPKVGPYTGNKTAIPSNAVRTEPAEANAVRVAGGWDVDRVFIDLGDAAFIQSLFEAAAEDYVLNSNDFAAVELIEAATDDGVQITGTAALSAALVQMGMRANRVGARLTWLAVADDVFEDFAALTRDDVPWWLTNGNALDLSNGQGQVGPFRFWADEKLSAGEFVGGDSRAATYFEQGSTPIRVQALNIPNGGIDLGVFGYNALIVNDARALYHGTLGAAA